MLMRNVSLELSIYNYPFRLIGFFDISDLGYTMKQAKPVFEKGRLFMNALESIPDVPGFWVHVHASSNKIEMGWTGRDYLISMEMDNTPGYRFSVFDQTKTLPDGSFVHLFSDAGNWNPVPGRRFSIPLVPPSVIDPALLDAFTRMRELYDYTEGWTKTLPKCDSTTSPTN